MDQLININLRESNRADVAFIVAVKSAWVSEKSGLHISRDISKKGVFILAGPPREIDADLNCTDFIYMFS